MTESFSSIKFSVVFFCLCLLGACGGSGSGGAVLDSGPQATPVVDSGTVSPPSNAPIAPSTPSASNSAPVVEGDPVTQVSVGEAYSFVPAVSDANGDPVIFSVENLPRWAHFDASSGALTGTPSSADVSTYPNILISANDGQATTSLAVFTITVVDSANGSATVSWFPPTQNTDGTALTNLAGYVIHFGRVEENLNRKIKITNSSVSRYLIGNLTSGKWHFAVSALNSRGIESSLSDIASKTVF